MKTTRTPLLVFFFLAAALFTSCQEAVILTIEADQIVNETGFGQPMNWFDEQDPSSVPVTSWTTPGIESYWPAGIVIDLGGEVKLDHLMIFDGDSSQQNESGNWEHRGGKLVFSSGSPFEWTEFTDFELSNDQSWHKLPLELTTRYLQVKKVPTESYYWEEHGPFLCDLNVNEILVFGWPGMVHKEEVTKGADPKIWKQRFTMKEFMGANSYKWIPDEVNKAVGIIRDYHHWGSNGVLTLDSAYRWVSRDGLTDMDAYYERIHLTDEFETFPDVHRHADPNLPLENKPGFEGSPDQASSYAVMADYMFQFAARYGHVEVDAARLKVAMGEDTLTGMGWVNYYECWNEPDRWWGIADAHFTPYELAAMSSAAYDGHRQTMGPDFGIKSADPAAKLVLGGLTSLDLQYMDAMLLWADYHREGSFPVDVINFHHYSNSAGLQHQSGKVMGISPEADRLQERLEHLVRWRDQHLPDCELWLSEFGWDTHETSSQSATGHELYPEEVDMFYLQAIWLVRGYLLGAASGIDRMFMYLANDLGNDGLYRNCGLVYEDYSPKPSWYFVHTLKVLLSDLRFSGTLDTGREDVYAFRFENAVTGRVVTALWCPTSDGTSVEDFSFPVPAEAQNISLVELAGGEENGIRSVQAAHQGFLQLNISEKPLFVEYKVNR